MRQPTQLEQARASDRPKTRQLGILKRLLTFIAPYRGACLIALVALTVAACTVLALGLGIRHLVDNAFTVSDGALLNEAVAVLLAAVAILAVATYARFYLVSWIGERVVADIRKAVYNQVLRLSPAYFETAQTGEVLSRLTTDTTLLQAVVGTTVSVALRNLLLLIGGTILLAITSAKLTGLVFLLVPLVVVPVVVYGRQVRRLSRASQDRVAEIGAQIDESLNAIRTLQAFTHESVEQRTFGGRVEAAFEVARKRIAARSLLTAAVILLVFTAISLVLWVGGRDVLAGDITGGDLSAFVFYAIVVAGALSSLSEVMGDLQRAAGATERLFELLESEPDIQAPAEPKPLPQPPRGAVAFEGITFSYPARPDWASLEGFDLSVNPGERLALVGPSGAGKTTVFQLILRFYDPQQGRVTFDGIDLRDLDPQALRGAIGLVPQEPVIFAASARDNILYGRPDASEADLLAAAEAAHARDFIEALPEGFGSFLGERGVRLSGGQRQRIAIARALLRNPPLLLLDEATSSLDAESERAVQQALDKLMVGRTTIVIAHRLATVLKAERIVVIDRGEIVDSGRHEELITRKGLYARLAALQFDQGKAEAEAAAGAEALTPPQGRMIAE